MNSQKTEVQHFALDNFSGDLRKTKFNGRTFPGRTGSPYIAANEM